MSPRTSSENLQLPMEAEYETILDELTPQEDPPQREDAAEPPDDESTEQEAQSVH